MCSTCQWGANDAECTDYRPHTAEMIDDYPPAWDADGRL